MIFFIVTSIFCPKSNELVAGNYSPDTKNYALIDFTFNLFLPAGHHFHFTKFSAREGSWGAHSRGALIKLSASLRGRSFEGGAHSRGALIRGNTVLTQYLTLSNLVPYWNTPKIHSKQPFLFIFYFAKSETKANISKSFEIQNFILNMLKTMNI